jgi:ABC-type uncharacterized transport system substrate-binding protein
VVQGAGKVATGLIGPTFACFAATFQASIPAAAGAMRALRILDIFCGAAMAAALMAAPASAHPHVFADARLELLINPDGTVKSLRHVWRFDDFFSSTVLVQFDKNKDLKLEKPELAALEKTVHDSLADYNYFQLVTQNGKDVAMQAPAHMIADFKDNRFLLLFESHPKEPLKLAGKTDFVVYDPTFYTAIDFHTDADLVVDGLPANCAKKVIRPDPDQAIAQNQKTLTDAFFNDPTDLSKIFATKLEITCQP